GIAEVTPTFVLLLVDSAECPEDIDKNRAEAARIRAEERLQHKQSMHEYYQTKIALDRAMQRLQTAAKYKR
ncbi:MAG: ATP synthase delta/epsilon chain alpha-helix domain-containing protein, partial [Faecalibacterium prausnitzii]